MIEITEEMLDAIEAVKGRREPQYWDHQCRRYMEKQKNFKNMTKDELEKKKNELIIKKKNEFPQLIENSHINLDPKASCWNDLSKSKIYGFSNSVIILSAFVTK